MGVFMTIMIGTTLLIVWGIAGYAIRDIQSDILNSKSKSIFTEKDRLAKKIGDKMLKIRGY